jgi:hypothetical protein
VSKNEYQHFQFQLEKEWEDEIQDAGKVVLPIDHICKVLAPVDISTRLKLDKSFFVMPLSFFFHYSHPLA